MNGRSYGKSILNNAHLIETIKQMKEGQTIGVCTPEKSYVLRLEKVHVQAKKMTERNDWVYEQFKSLKEPQEP